MPAPSLDFAPEMGKPLPRLAMRTSTTSTSTVNWIIGDHPFATLRTGFGSTNVVADINGNDETEFRAISRTLYKPWGEVRYQSGTIPTNYTYTGQYSHTADFGLMFYNARWYDPSLGRFAQADSIIPGAMNPMAFDRFSYVYNNPIRLNDPSGHRACEDEDLGCSGPPRGYLPEKTDPSPLDEWGEKMKDMYADLKDDWGWETPWDFMQAMLAFELGDLYKYLEANPGDEGRLIELLAHTATHWMSWISNCSNNCSRISENMIFNFVGRSHSIRDRYSVWKGGGNPNFTISAERGKLAAGIIQKMQDAPREWLTGGFSSNGHVSTWGNSQYLRDGVWVNFWANQDKIDEFSAPNMSNGFNQTGSSGHTVSFKFGNFTVLTADEAAYWTQP